MLSKRGLREVLMPADKRARWATRSLRGPVGSAPARLHLPPALSPEGFARTDCSSLAWQLGNSARSAILEALELNVLLGQVLWKH